MYLRTHSEVITCRLEFQWQKILGQMLNGEVGMTDLPLWYPSSFRKWGWPFQNFRGLVSDVAKL